jgi:hypothetical protein
MENGSQTLLPGSADSIRAQLKRFTVASGYQKHLQKVSIAGLLTIDLTESLFY